MEESADIVEEVARIVGFDRIPGTIPSGPLPTPHHDVWYERADMLRDVLVGAGLTEIVSYPLTSRERMAHLLRGVTSGEEQLLGAPVATPSPDPSPAGRGEGIHARPSDASWPRWPSAARHHAGQPGER